MPQIFSITQPQLAGDVASFLSSKLGEVDVSSFASGEQRVQVLSKRPINENMALVIEAFSDPIETRAVAYLNLIEALRYQGYTRIHTVITWSGYSLQDRRFSFGESDAFSVFRQMIDSQPVEQTWVIDLHTPTTAPSWKNKSVWNVFVQDWKLRLGAEQLVLVSPDEGSAPRVEAFAKKCQFPFIVLQKKRSSGGVQVSVPADSQPILQGKTVIIIDDVLNTGSTVVAAAEQLQRVGAERIEVCATHGLLVGDCVSRLEASGIERITITNTIPEAVHKAGGKVRVVSIAGQLADFPDVVG